MKLFEVLYINRSGYGSERIEADSVWLAARACYQKHVDPMFSFVFISIINREGV